MKATVTTILASFVLSVPMAAHHSWTADYDAGKPVTVKGVVTKVEWTNPHTHFYIESKDEKEPSPTGTSKWRARSRWNVAAGRERRFRSAPR